MRRILLALSLVLMTSVSVAAQDDPREVAREAYGRGQAAFDAGDFATAEGAFQEAYNAMPNPIVLKGIAECRHQQGNLAGEVETLRRYLTERPDASDRVEIQARIDAIAAQPGRLTITSTPSGANISIDGASTGFTTPRDMPIPAGEHTIALSLSGHEPATRQLETSFASQHTMHMELTAIPEPDPVTPDPVTPDPVTPDPVTPDPVTADPVTPDVEVNPGGGGTLGPDPELLDPEPEVSDEVPTTVWVAAGIAGVGLVGGTIFGVMALSDESAFMDTPSEELADSGESKALISDIFFGVAVAAGITAVVLYLTRDKGESDRGLSAIVPTVLPDGGGVVATGSF